jgi:hypothetical protein
MHPLTSQIVRDRQRDLACLAGPGLRRLPRRRAVSRRIGLALIRAGRRLAGPEELARLPARARSVLSPYR